MAELIEVADIPLGTHKQDRYPWAEWEAMLQTGQPGQAIKLVREDFPPSSGAYRNWGDGVKRRAALQAAARTRGMKIAIRGNDMYLWYGVTSD